VPRRRRRVRLARRRRPKFQGWQGRGVAGVAGRRKVATPPGSRGAEKCRGRCGSLNFQSLWSRLELESPRDLIALVARAVTRTMARATARLGKGAPPGSSAQALGLRHRRLRARTAWQCGAVPGPAASLREG
jgi:hypothetical protein